MKPPPTTTTSLVPMPTYSEIRQWALDALTKIGREDLKGKLRIDWNTRYTRCMGTYSPTVGQIELSTQLFRRATTEQRKQTVVHELCHMVVDFSTRRVFLPAPPPHGTLWQRTMRLAGMVPTRCHKVDRTGLKRKNATVSVKCGCPVKTISKCRATKMYKGTLYKCGHCTQIIRFK